MTRVCDQCRGEIDGRFRFCPWCAAPQRPKLVEFFRPHGGIPMDRRKALRVSRYLSGEQAHVRFSVWHGMDDRAEAEAAVSLDEDEAERLARFLVDTGEDEKGPEPRTITMEIETPPQAGGLR